MKNYLSLLILFLILGNGINEIYAQVNQSEPIRTNSTGYLKVTGEVEHNKKSLENSIITVFENDNKINQVITGKDGKFNLKLEFDKFYMVEVTKPGLVNKKFGFDTHLPDSAEKHIIYPFNFMIVLFSNNLKDIDYRIFDKHLGIIQYDKQYKDFFYDYNYAKSINETVIGIQNKVENITNAYFKLIEEGDNQFDLKNYKKARKIYEKATKIFSDELYPKDRIKEINKILGK